MRYITTRLSYERRVKLILICIVLTFASFVVFSVRSFSETEKEEIPLPSSRTNLLRTSNSEEHYSVFETEKNTITARGRYTGDNARKLYIDNEKLELAGTYSFSAHEDGSYDAVITTSAFDTGIHKLSLKLNSGAVMRYYVFYDDTNGWYFPIMSFEESNAKVFDHIFEAPAEASALYLSPTKDPDEISAALEQISSITAQITEGIEDDYEKALAISRFVADKIYYDLDARDTNVDIATVALCNVLKTGRTVCAGFANLFCAMAEAAGIDAVNIKGGIYNDSVKYADFLGGIQNHEWAAFYYEKEDRWVWADPCWDGTKTYEKGEYKDSVTKLMFFDITTEALALNHNAIRAERRHYFAAKPETEPLGVSEEPEGEPQSVITSQQTEPPTTLETPEAPVTEDTTQEDTGKTEVPEQSDTVYIIIIAALAAAILIVGAVTAVIIVKGRKRDMVVIELENGKKIKAELYPEIAPETVANFEKLVNKGFYNGLTFHRVINGFMIQGGCPHGNGTGNSGERIKGEFSANGFDNDLKHTRGVLSMARSADPNSASCQFFIMHKDAPHLDGNYAAFGKVVEGMDAVDEIAECETDYADKPITPVVMKSVRIED